MQSGLYGEPGGFTGNIQENGTSGSVYGVKSVINTNLSTFRPCTLTVQEEEQLAGSTSAWIAVVPAAGNPEMGNGDAVLQLGVVHCNYAGLPDLCDPGVPGVGTPSYFWAFGGCGTAPDGIWIGDTDDNQHTYEIRHFSSPQSGYSMYFDGVYTQKTIYVSDWHVSCWLGSRHGAMYQTETWDAGDGIANPDGKVIFSTIGWRITDSGAWQAPTWSGTAPCDTDDVTIYLNLKCDISNLNNTQFYAWSTLN